MSIHRALENINKYELNTWQKYMFNYVQLYSEHINEIWTFKNYVCIISLLMAEIE